jgi:3-hydroxy-5-phosphonooxypentane-2,4-dione thiolase
MDWGMKNRMSKIIRPEDNRCVMLAVDHGYFLGPTERLEVPSNIIKPLLSYADSLMLTRGILRTSVNPNNGLPIVLRVSGGSSIVGEDLSNETITTSVEEAIRLNASCLAISIFVGSKHEHQTLSNLAKLVNEGERYGIPVLAVTAVGKEMARDARYLGLACRIAAELGAHIVKTYYCENFEKVIEGCPIPVIIAGGKKLQEVDALELAYNAVQHGAAGVDMGRNIWQSDYAVEMIKAVRAIVHENLNVNEAYNILLKAKNEKGEEKGQLQQQKIVKSTD